MRDLPPPSSPQKTYRNTPHNKRLVEDGVNNNAKNYLHQNRSENAMKRNEHKPLTHANIESQQNISQQNLKPSPQNFAVQHPSHMQLEMYTTHMY